MTHKAGQGTSEDYAPVSVPDADGKFPENGLERLRRLVAEREKKAATKQADAAPEAAREA